MGNYVSYSPWTDAAAYGRGLGDTLSQALLQMPQQRAQLGIQQQTVNLHQLHEAQQMAQQQAELHAQRQAQLNQYRLGAGQLDLHAQELHQNEQYHQAELGALQAKIEQAKAGTWKLGETKDGRPYKINTATGDHEWLPMDGDVGGLGKPPIPATGGQINNSALEALKIWGAANQTGQDTNNPVFYNQVTNTVMPMLERARALGLGQPASQMPQGGLAPSNATSLMSPGVAAPTNKIFNFNPATGQLE